LRSQQGEADRDKRDAVGKSKRKESVAPKITMFSVIIEFGNEFEFTAPVFIVGRVVNDENFSFVVGDESTDKNNDFHGNNIQKTSPIVPWRIEESVNGVTPEFKSIATTNGKSPEITVLEDEEKKSLEDGEKIEALRFSSAGTKKSAR
jgi:hypothetical protein